MATRLPTRCDGGIFAVPIGVPVGDIPDLFPPATDAEIGSALATLFAGLRPPRAESGEAAAMTAAVYRRVIARWPAWAIEDAVTAFLAGDVDGASRAFVPTTAELNAEVRRRFFARVRRGASDGARP